ncbi:MAG: M3 family metallopeptidase [Gammaproteobacteria bacterium]|nr:M3 family metallopeptidase [Gammaproteobacteria bacterium]
MQIGNNKGILLITIAVLLSAVTACSKEDKESQVTENTQESKMTENNILLAEWEGPYQGVPAFDKMDLTAIKPALEKAMALRLAEIDAITANQEPASFENTILALERSGKVINRVFSYWRIWGGNISSPGFREIQQEMAPKLSTYNSKITQNAKLFERVKSVYESEAVSTMRSDQQRLVQLTYDGFARNGATLKGEAKKRTAEINQRLAELYTDFSNNILADEENYVVYLEENQLGGLSDSLKTSAKSAAVERGQKDKWAITNTRSSMDPFLKYSTERELREKVWNNYYSRGDNGDEFDNNSNIVEILKLRHERVGLLGYKNYAQWRLENRMAQKPENAIKLMKSVWTAAIARVAEEVADMQAVADAEGANIKIKPWDYRYYAEKVRKTKYNLDSGEVKQYLQLSKLREAMFYVAGRLFGFNFTAVPEGSVPVYHPDVKVWEVTDKATGKHIGLWYLDPFSRKGKRSGAWATSYRSFESFDHTNNVLASNNSNFVKGKEGEAVLISWSDAETYFHEFGHALHYLSSKVAYPRLNGGVRDYTEFQSQLLERWLTTDEVMNTYLVHYQTGEPIPVDLVSKIKKAATFNQGFKTTEYLASALMDMKYHTMDPEGLDPDSFERETLAALKMPEELVMRHRSPHFGHAFSGEGYSAGYYGYMWAEVLTSDAAAAFAEAPGGFYDQELAKKLVDHLFAIRNAMDPADAYREFRGRDAKVDALMQDRGFPVTDQ